MKSFPLKLIKRLDKRKADNSFRSLGGSPPLIDFSSNDYLGFSSSPAIFDRAHQILSESGLQKNGSSGSRLLTGNHSLYEVTENILSTFHEAGSALIFNSGYDANIGFFSTIPKKEDVVLFDEFIHASIRDGIRMGLAGSFKFRHNDLQDLESKLKKHSEKARGEIYIVTESVFSMDGDTPDLKELVILSERYNGLLIIDEAHAIGVFGKRGEGLVQELGLQEQVFARIITFGKALGAHGAAVLGSVELKDYLLNFARSFIYTTALPPHSVATIIAAYQQLQPLPGNYNGLFVPGAAEMKKLRANILYFLGEVERKSLECIFLKSNSAIQSCIFPGNDQVKQISAEMAARDFSVKPILSPTVPQGKERLRFCLHSFNSFEEISEVLNVLSKFAANRESSRQVF